MLRERDEGRLADGRQPLGQYLEREWLPGVSAVSKRGRPLAPTTRQRYSEAVRHVSAVIGKVRLADLRPHHIERLRDRLLADGKLQPQTVADIMRVLSQALGRAEARGLVGRNPAAPQLVNRPSGKRPRFAGIDKALADRILEAVQGEDPWDVSVHFALGLGLRREEVLGLRWEDVSEDAVCVQQALTYAGGEYHFGPPKSAAGERDLPLPTLVARALQRHRKAQAERLWPLGGRSELVVDDGTGKPWLPASFSTGWRRFAKGRGLPPVPFHGLRHGAASLLLAAGVADKVALEVMGHAGTEMLHHYQEVADELKRDAASRMDQLLGRL
jgi:integrase